MTSHPSPTAAMSAAARAAHLEVDAPPHLLGDEVAVRLLDELGLGALGYHRTQPGEPVLVGARTSTLLRARYAEDRLSASRATQVVLLGAGLDTAPLRAAAGRTWFAVDRPAVLAWRAALVERAGLGPDARSVPVELGREPLVPALVRAGLDATEPAFVTWLGVTMYLDEPAVRACLAELASLAPGTELVLDHLLPREDRDDAGRAYAEAVDAAAGANGEPWQWTPGDARVRAVLSDCGFTVLDSRPDHEAVPAAAWDRADHLRPSGLARLVHARVG